LNHCALLAVVVGSLLSRFGFSQRRDYLGGIGVALDQDLVREQGALAASTRSTLLIAPENARHRPMS
jgi:hypothetical protein